MPLRCDRTDESFILSLQAPNLMIAALPSLFSREVLWLLAAAVGVGLLLAWILRSAPPGQSARAEEDEEAPRSGYRDRMIAGVVAGLLLIAAGGYLALSRGCFSRCRPSRWDSRW